jgi:hypothetical protein
MCATNKGNKGCVDVLISAGAVDTHSNKQPVELFSAAGPAGVVAATILACAVSGEIDTIKRDGQTIGFWIMRFPAHVERDYFIKSYFKVMSSAVISDRVASGRYTISPDSSRGGYNVSVGT